MVGPGLGNLLFPWARAVVFARKRQLPVVWPTWPQVKIGSLIRRERDTRFYTDLFQRPENYVGGLARVRALASSTRISEQEAATRSALGTRQLVVFKGMDGLFSSILDASTLVRDELLSMTRDEHKAGYQEQPGVAVHVRLGDFLPAPEATLERGAYNYRIGLPWYLAKLQQLQRVIGDAPVDVYSDGSDEELEPLLALPRVRRRFHGSAIADMLALSRARVLIASGSTFSMWASYIGRMPVVWHPGQLRQRLYGSSPGAEIESAETSELPTEFLEHVRSAVDDAGPRVSMVNT